VAVLSQCNAWAVGWSSSGLTDLTLVDHWNGRAWKQVPSPTPAGSTQGELLGVSAISANDIWAVGSYDLPTGAYSLIEHWNGTAWSEVPSPSPGGNGTTVNAGLTSVAAVSPTDAWAGGTYADLLDTYSYKSLIEHWNGTAWSEVPSPSPGGNGTTVNAGLTSVAAVSPTDAWAVGTDADLLDNYSYKTLIEHWNGANWSQVPSPNPGTPDGQGQAFNRLLSVTALPGSTAWAVGSYDTTLYGRTLILHWNGTAWQQDISPNGNLVGNNGLTGVSASAANNAWAVGGYDNGSGPRALVAHWNGFQWVRVASPNPSPAPYQDHLNAVLTRSPTSVWAAGYWDQPGVGPKTWMLHWNGVKWTTISTPNPGGSLHTNELIAISGTSCANIWAVGDYYNNSLTQAIAAHCQ